MFQHKVKYYALEKNAKLSDHVFRNKKKSIFNDEFSNFIVRIASKIDNNGLN